MGSKIRRIKRNIKGSITRMQPRRLQFASATSPLTPPKKPWWMRLIEWIGKVLLGG